jgi:hypothetical protein
MSCNIRKIQNLISFRNEYKFVGHFLICHSCLSGLRFIGNLSSEQSFNLREKNDSRPGKSPGVTDAVMTEDEPKLSKENYTV